MTGRARLDGRRKLFSYIYKVVIPDIRDEYVNHRGSMVEPPFHLIHNLGDDSFELYDMVADPREQTDISGEEKVTLSYLKKALLDYVGSLEKPTETRRKELSHEEIESLRSLGYIN